MCRRSSILVVFMVLALAACSKKKDKAPAAAGSGSAVATGSGSAMAGSGSDAGSGSAMVGSGSDAGSGSAMAGSGSATAGSGSDAGSAAAGSGSGAAPVDFEKLSHDDKVKFMKTKVMPVMKPAFQKFDAKEFASFTCKTCHGKDPQKSKHEMPTPDLPKLDWDAIKKGEEKEWVDFMENTVEPEMARILGKPQMTKDQPNGFGCLDCHMEKKKK